MKGNRFLIKKEHQEEMKTDSYFIAFNDDFENHLFVNFDSQKSAIDFVEERGLETIYDEWLDFIGNTETYAADIENREVFVCKVLSETEDEYEAIVTFLLNEQKQKQKWYQSEKKIKLSLWLTPLVVITGILCVTFKFGENELASKLSLFVYLILSFLVFYLVSKTSNERSEKLLETKIPYWKFLLKEKSYLCISLAIVAFNLKMTFEVFRVLPELAFSLHLLALGFIVLSTGLNTTKQIKNN